MTTDPIISDPSFGQSFNPYSYVLNNPLTYVDPSGWDGEPKKPEILPDSVREKRNPDGSVDVYLHYPKRGAPPKPKESAEPGDGTEKVGVAVPATDTDPTGSQAPPVGSAAG